MKVRPATKADEPRILELWEQVAERNGKTPPLFRMNVPGVALEAIDRGACLVAENGVGVVGMVSLAPAPLPYCLPSLLVVDEKARGLGVGRALMRAAHDLARERGADRGLLLLFDGDGNQPFYEACGYHEIGKTMEIEL